VIHSRVAPNPGDKYFAHISAPLISVWQLDVPKVPRAELANAVFWTVKREQGFDPKESVLDFCPPAQGQDGGKAKSLLAYAAPRQDVDQLKRLFKDMGLPLAGVVATPFVLPTLRARGLVDAPEGCWAHLHMSEEWSSIAIYQDQHLELFRSIRTGFGGVVEAVMAEFNEGQGRSNVTELVANSQGNGPSCAMPKSVQLSDVRNALMERSENNAALTKLAGPAMDRLMRQVERTFDHFTRALSQPPVGSLALSGSAAGSPVLAELMANRLELAVNPVDPLSAPGLTLAPEAQAARPEERTGLVVATGLALDARGEAPNLVDTISQRLKREKSERQRVFAVLAGLLLTVLAGIGVFAHGYRIDALETRRTQLQAQMQTLTPGLDAALLEKQTKQLREEVALAHSRAKRVVPAAALSELARLMPPWARMTHLTMKQNPQQAEDGMVSVQVGGFVIAEEFRLDQRLTQFLMLLRQSPMVHATDIRRGQSFVAPEGPGLHFELDLEVVAEAPDAKN
jgi:Tfp pilus assembly PilM family ATPase/Tfp pilus assembly protein PilN